MSHEAKLREYLKRVTTELHQVSERLEEAEGREREPIAVIGMSCRLPGGISSPRELWQAVSTVTAGPSSPKAYATRPVTKLVAAPDSRWPSSCAGESFSAGV